MKTLYFIFFILILNQCYGQIKSDTLFSGKTRFVDMSQSISKLLIDNLQGVHLCTEKPLKLNLIKIIYENEK